MPAGVMTPRGELAVSVALAAFILLLTNVTARAGNEPAECPSGTHRILTSNPYEPFKCVTADEDKKAGFEAVAGPKGFSSRPRCPYGTRPVASTGNALQSYRCVRATAEQPDPELSPLREGDAPSSEAGQAEATPAAAKRPSGDLKARAREARESVRYVIPRELSFEYPRRFLMRDAWKEDVPTLYLKLENDMAGKPVTITVSRYEPSQPSFQSMEAAIARDIEWQDAKDAGFVPLADGRARSTAVPGESRSVYLATSDQAYYAFIYSASSDDYESYLPAFNRLLSTLRLDRSGR